MKKLVIIVTVPVVLETWLKGQAKFLAQFYDVEIITAYSETIKDIAVYEGIPICTVDFNRDINLFRDLKVLKELVIHLHKIKPDFVYTLTPKAALLGMIASWLVRVPYRVHNIVGLPHLEAVGKRKTILTVTEKITYSFATHLYCNSLVLRDIVATMSHKPVGVIGNGSVNGVDTEIFKDTMSAGEKLYLRTTLGFTAESFIITFVGRIVNDKGINELIDVFKILAQEKKHARLLLIGDYKDELDSISDESKKILESHPAIKYLEFQEDVRSYLSISNLFVLPSYREGLPNVLIEAGSIGVPLIATNINGCNEVVLDGVNGLLVEKKDRDSLLNAIRLLINDENFYNKIKSNVRLSIVEKYDQNFFWESLHDEFDKIGSLH